MLTRQVLEAARRGQWEPLQAVPKADLHAHFLFSAPFSHYESLAGRRLEPPPPRFAGVLEMLAYLRRALCPLFTRPEHYPQTLEAILGQIRADGVVYSEMVFDLSLPRRVGADWAAVVSDLGPIKGRFHDRLRLSPELGVSRERATGDWLERARVALDTGFFEGVDVYGDEHHCPIEHFDAFFTLARSRGLRLKLHSGETGDGERLRRELLHVQPDAVQHGNALTAVEQDFPGLRVNLCPASNIALGYAPDYASHPILTLLRGGRRVTVNTDDFGVFGSSLSRQFLALYEAGATPGELERIRGHGLSADLIADPSTRGTCSPSKGLVQNSQARLHESPS